MGASVGGFLDCSGGRFENGRENALSFDGMTISGGVYLANGFHATGQVRLAGARIGGDLVCEGGTFVCRGRCVLAFNRARVDGNFFFRDIAELDGGVDVGEMQVGGLCDDIDSWIGTAGELILDGFTYGRFAGDLPVDAASRIAWLERQWYQDLGGEFRPQPWEQLITVLRAMGHSNDARAVAITKQNRLRRAGKVVRGARALHWLYGLLVGYGYRPLRLLGATGSVWLICALAYWAATNPAVFGARTFLLAPPERASTSTVPPQSDYANFVPLIYSADVLLPVVDLGYKDEWQPVVADRAGNPLFWGRALRFLYWFEIAFGWVAGLLLVGVLGNLIKKD